MNNKIFLKFVLFTFLLTYFSWGSIIIANHFGYLKYGTPISMILFLIGGNAPPIISYILLRHNGTYASFKEFLKAVFKFKQPISSYLITIGFVGLYFIVPTILNDVNWGIPFYLAILIIPLMVLGGGLEELGWRGILQPSLENKLPFVAATMITAFTWSLWHLPLFFIEGTNQFGTSFLMFAISVFGMSFALAAIYKLCKSIWLCILFHSMVNAFFETFKFEQSPLVVVVTASVMVFTPIVLVWYFEHHNKSRTL